GAARPDADEVGLVEREAAGEGRDLDEAADALGCRGRHAEPVPAVLDDLAERADRDTPPLLGQGLWLAHEAADGRGLSPAREPDGERRRLGGVPPVALEPAAVHLEVDAPRVVRRQDAVEGRVEQRLVIPPERTLDEARIDERGERVS